MKVLGVGFGRTGTMSLKQALEDVGAGPCFHMIDLIRDNSLIPAWHDAAIKGEIDFDRMFTGFEATIDWPGCTFWRELIEYYPETPVLLNVRDFDGWYKSVENTVWALRQAAMSGQDVGGTEDAPPPELWQVIGKLIWERDFQDNFEDRDWMRSMYEARIEEIKSTVPAERLTVFKLEENAGWEPIAAMLGIEPPATEFPHLHDTNEFRAEFGLAPV